MGRESDGDGERGERYGVKGNFVLFFPLSLVDFSSMNCQSNLKKKVSIARHRISHTDATIEYRLLRYYTKGNR